MKKMISLFLVLVIITVSYGSALSDTIQLPGQLEIIGAEAFYGDISIDQVILPDGVKEIHSKAFANSSLEEIYLPGSITYIADDAFDEPQYVRVSAEKGTYAYAWAVEHGYINETRNVQELLFALQLLVESAVTGEDDVTTQSAIKFFQLWASENGHPDLTATGEMDDLTLEAMQACVDAGITLRDEYKAYIEDAFDFLMGDGLQSEDLQMEPGNLLPTEGITDPEELAQVEEFNALTLLLNQSILDYNTHLEEFSDSVGALANDMGGAMLNEGTNTVSFSYGRMHLEMDRTVYEAMGADGAFSECELSEDGDMVMLQMNGVDYYAVADGSTLYITASQSRAVSRGGNAEVFRRTVSRAAHSMRDLFSNSIRKLDNLWQAIDGGLGTAIEYVENSIAAQNAIIESYDAMKNKNFWDTIRSLSEKSKLDKMHQNLTMLRGFSAALAVVSIPSQIQGAQELLRRWIEIDEIAAHGHPTVDDIRPNSRETANMLVMQITTLRILYTTTGLTTLLGLVSSCTAITTFLVGLTTGTGSVTSQVSYRAMLLAIATIAGTAFLDALGTGIYRMIRALDAELHTRVWGVVKDKETGKALQYVSVVSGASSTWTDAEGYYSMAIDPGTQTITYSLDHYNQGTATVALRSGTSTRKDMALEKPVATPTPTPTPQPDDGNPIPIDAAHFPDDVFRQYVKMFDRNNSDMLGVWEIAAVHKINISDANLRSLDGIEHFTNLTTLDVSGCTALEFLDCRDNQLTSLNVSGCTALEVLLCTDNQLTSLNVSGCTALEVLDCRDNQLTSLNVSGCTALEGLLCEKNQLTSLNLGGYSKLDYLTCWGNQLTSLNVSGYTALYFLACENNQLTSLNVNNCTALYTLWCGFNQLTSLDVSNCTILGELACDDNVTVIGWWVENNESP